MKDGDLYFGFQLVLLRFWLFGGYFLKVKKVREFNDTLKKDKLRDVKHALKTHWLMFRYLIFLMAGFNFMSHSSQDLYPTLLTKQTGISANAETVIMVCANLGAICGGLFFGQLSELYGRRLTIIICCIFAGAFIYPAFFLKSESGIIGGVFFLQFGVMGCWGIAPVHLFELVPSSHRTFAAGLAYQLGNLASSASSTIEAELGARFPISGAVAGTYNYANVMAIFVGCVFAYMMVVAFLGPERFHRDLQIYSVEDEENLKKLEENDEKLETKHEDYV